MTSKSFYSLVFMILFSSCNETQIKNVESSGSDTGQITNADTSLTTLNAYRQFITKLDTFNVETVSAAARKYQELFKNSDGATKDQGFGVFNTYYERLTQNINVLHEKDTTNFEPFLMLEGTGEIPPLPKELKAYNDHLKQNGFEITSSEGMTFIRQDRDFIAKYFYSFVSIPMKEYLQQLNKESKEGFADDGRLTIGAEQYVKRLVWWDNFIQANPNFLMIDDAKENRKTLLTFFLIGMDNTPVIDYQVKKLDKYFKNAYTYLEENYPNSETNKIVNPYFKSLMQNDKAKATALLDNYRKDGVIIDFRKDF